MKESIDSLQHELSYIKAQYKALNQQFNAASEKRNNLITQCNALWCEIDILVRKVSIAKQKQNRLIELCNTSCWRYRA